MSSWGQQGRDSIWLDYKAKVPSLPPVFPSAPLECRHSTHSGVCNFLQSFGETDRQMIILKLFPNPIKHNMVKDREAFMSLGKKNRAGIQHEKDKCRIY